jgi:carboxyl-terminal processing protease
VKINQRWAWILACAALATNLLIGFRVYSNEAAADSESEALEKLTIMMRVMYLIRQDYVDGERTDYQALIASAIHGMVSNLDPHSSYLEPVDYEDMLEMTEGQFGGVGIIVTIRNGLLTVVSPVEGTPGSRAGLQAGDRIIEIDGESTQDMWLQDAVHRMKGEPGTEVELVIYRPSEDREIEVTIVRDIIEVASVKGTRMLVDGIGYVRVTQFDENSATKLGEAIEELTEQGAESLVLDLRNNPGGLLTAAVDMCGYFLPPQTLVVSTEGRRESQKLEFRTLGQTVRFEEPLAILVNGGSASASEIVAGCLKDHKRAMLVGEKTFGKGSVQNVIPLPDGSALRLTTAMYYTPKRLIIHENGIDPDIVVEMTVAEQEELQSIRMEALKDGGEIDYSLDPQLNRAVQTLQSYSRFQATETRK